MQPSTTLVGTPVASATRAAVRHAAGFAASVLSTCSKTASRPASDSGLPLMIASGGQSYLGAQAVTAHTPGYLVFQVVREGLAIHEVHHVD